MQGCTFCGPVTDDLGVGVCMLATNTCPAAEPALQAYSVGCPSGHLGMVLGSLLLYLAAFSPGVGPVPWAVNAEIYPSQVGHLPAAYLCCMQMLGPSKTRFSSEAWQTAASQNTHLLSLQLGGSPELRSAA